MLDAIRKRKDNLIYTGIILMVVAVMALYGVGQMAKEGGGGGGVAAYVNGDVISRREFVSELEQRTYQFKALFGGQFDEKFLEQFNIPQSTLTGLVQLKLLSQQANKMGIRVTDLELASHIRSLPYYQREGKFDQENYTKMPHRGEEEKSTREKLSVNHLQSYVGDRIRLTPAALKTAYQTRETKIDVWYAKLDFKELGKNQKPSPAQVDEYLKATPQKDFEAYYEAHRKEFTTPAAVKLRQIRVGIPYQANSEQKEGAKKKIEAAVEALKKGSFAEVAKKHSDDEYAKKGGEVGWVNRGTLEPTLEAAIDRLETGKASEPLETSFGYFILLADQKRPEVVKPLAEMKLSIAQKLLAEKQAVEWGEKKKKEWEAVVASGRPLDAELKKAGVELKKTGPFSPAQGDIPGIGRSDSLLDTVIDLTPANPVAKTLVPNAEVHYYLKLNNIERAKLDDFSKNQEMVEKSSGTAMQSAVLQDWVQALQKNATIKMELKFAQPSADAE